MHLDTQNIVAELLNQNENEKPRRRRQKSMEIYDGEEPKVI